MTKKTNAQILRELRHRLKLTQTEFGEMLGLVQKRISSWEIGLHKISDLKLLGIICFFQSRVTRKAKIWPFFVQIKSIVLENIRRN